MPTTLTGLLIFTALIMPGFTFVTTYTWDRPRRRMSTLEGTAAIVLASLVTELAVAVVYSLVRLPARRGVPAVDMLVRQPGDHWAWIAGLLAVSSALAAGAAWLLSRRPVHPSVMSSWWMLFEYWKPEATKYGLSHLNRKHIRRCRAERRRHGVCRHGDNCRQATP